MAELSIDDFDEFFAQVCSGCDPFQWQSELVRQVHQDRCWPDLIDLPTGSGKTSLIDIAVFLLALDAGQPAEDWWMPRRTVLVVDRRVVVDQAEERGAHLARTLGSANDGVVRSVADRLRSLSGDERPLVTTVLRGGIVRDETWARRPDVPAVISSTVDQVGSRILFRGYGLSSTMRPVHAGLLGNDVLLLLDEVHLARPFAETLVAVEGYRHWRNGGGHSLPDRWHVVQLTATPTMDAERPFPAERLDPGSHPVLARRLLANKPARLEIAKVGKDTAKANEQLAATCVKLAQAQLQLPQVSTLAVIVNRVDAARHVARRLKELPDDLDVVLLTGRMRSLDRDRVLGEWNSRLRLGRKRQPDDKPLVVVATQSIEAGADFDFDSAVTECASLDALRQRFGRVDRDGRLSEEGTPSSSVIVIRSTDVGATPPDPVYGSALGSTWAWLTGLDHVDFGAEALAAHLEGVDHDPLLPQPSRAPRLLPGHLDQWVQTSQRPADTEAITGRWLHGIDQDEQLADVEVVWRADLHPSLLTPDDRYKAEISARVAACPPVSGEALSVSIVELRRWAAGEPSDPSASDAAAGGTIEEEEPNQQSHDSYLRWASGRAERVLLRDIRPGDTVLVPAVRGGLWLDNWDPSSSVPVVDIALEATDLVRRRAVARLSPCVSASLTDPPDPEVLGNESKRDRASAIKSYLTTLAAEAADANDESAERVFGHLSLQPWRELRVRPVADHLDGDTVRYSYVVTTRKRLSPIHTDLAPDDGADAGSFTGVRRVSLDAHLEGAGGWAQRFASNLGVGDELMADLRLAGRLHDLGKADSRFQRWLCGGSNGPPRGEFLAKSSTPDVDRLARQKARELSGYPNGARHELLSLAMAQAPNGPTRVAHDPELVRFLVASHHGFGRYRFDPCLELAPETVRFEIDGAELSASSDHGLLRLDTGVPDLFWRLVRRYGWFGLTWLEAVFRLADHARSREEQEQEIDDEAPAEVTP